MRSLVVLAVQLPASRRIGLTPCRCVVRGDLLRPTGLAPEKSPLFHYFYFFYSHLLPYLSSSTQPKARLRNRIGPKSTLWNIPAAVSSNYALALHTR